MRKAGPLRRPRTPRAAAAFGLVDQGLSSATNFAAVIVAAVLLPADSFGFYAMAYALYLVVLGALQALLSQVLVLESSEDGDHTGPAVRAAWLLGCGAGSTVALGAAALVPREDLAVFLVMASSLPALLVQDGLRTVAAVRGVPQVAVLSDATWLLAFGCIVLAVTSSVSNPGPAQLFACWALAGAGALVPAALLLGPGTVGGTSAAGVFRRGYLGWRFLTEYTLTQGVNQASIVAIGGVAGPVATGTLRGAASLYGPVGVVISAVPVLMVPPLRRMSSRARTMVYGFATAAFLTMPLALCVVLLALPNEWGQRVLGETWLLARPLLLPLGCQFAAIGMSTVAFTALRLVRPRETLRIRLVGSAVFLTSFWGGYLLGGVVWAAWGLCLGSTVQGLLAWATYVRARKDR